MRGTEDDTSHLDIERKTNMADADADIIYADYTDESMLPDIQRLVSRDLSEPYSVYTYRYFLHNCPRFCICAYAKDNDDPSKQTMIATVVCKLEGEGEAMHGYMAMLAVDKEYRKRGIAKKLVTMVIDRMVEDGCREVMLEAEASNQGALSLYSKLGFVRDEKMSKYYLNNGDAYRLKLWIDQKGGKGAAVEARHDAQPVESS